jgi:hypothetical protein
MIALPKILTAPETQPETLPPSSKWLAGEGAGSWFSIEKTDTDMIFKVRRFSPKGKFECEGLFKAQEPFNAITVYELTYPSHCAVVTINQNGTSISLRSINPNNLRVENV